MRIVLSCLFWLITSGPSMGQYSKIYFEEKDDYYKRNKFLSASYNSFPVVDKEFDLKNGEKSVNYAILRIPIQIDSLKKIKSFIDILAGATLKGNLFIITDVNKNKEFVDDSLYVLNMDTLFEKRSDYIKAWPQILIDSVNYYYDGKILTTPLLLSMALFPAPGFDYFKNSTVVLNNKKQFLVHVFRNKYLHSTFFLGDSAYEINIELFPFYHPAYKFLSETDELAFHQIAIYKHINEKDSLIYRTSLKEVIDNIDSKTPLKINGYKIYFQKLSLLEKYLQINITQESIADNQNNSNRRQILKEIRGFSIKDNKIIELKTGLQKYRVIFFSGSWCVPCRSALVDFTKLYLKYKGKADFLTIACENNSIEAKKYYNAHKSEWEFFYENIRVKKKSDLSNILKITVFPSFVLVDSNGNIVYQGISADSIFEIDKILGE